MDGKEYIIITMSSNEMADFIVIHCCPKDLGIETELSKSKRLCSTNQCNRCWKSKVITC